MPIACDGGRCAVSGPVTMRNVTAVLAESAGKLVGERVVFDLSGVTEVDSAAVSLLLEWRREGARAGTRVEFQNIPGNLSALAELYGVSDLIA